MLDSPRLGLPALRTEVTVLRHGGTGLVPGAVARSPQLAGGSGCPSRALAIGAPLARARDAPMATAREGHPPHPASRGERATAPGTSPAPPCRSTVNSVRSSGRPKRGLPSARSPEARCSVRVSGRQLVHLQPAVRIGVQQHRIGNVRIPPGAGHRIEEAATEDRGRKRGNSTARRDARPRCAWARGRPVRDGPPSAGPVGPLIPELLCGRLLATGLVGGRRPGAASSRSRKGPVPPRQLRRKGGRRPPPWPRRRAGRRRCRAQCPRQPLCRRPRKRAMPSPRPLPPQVPRGVWPPVPPPPAPPSFPTHLPSPARLPAVHRGGR